MKINRRLSNLRLIFSTQFLNIPDDLRAKTAADWTDY
jgi:hypothetical protein